MWGKAGISHEGQPISGCFLGCCPSLSPPSGFLFPLRSHCPATALSIPVSLSWNIPSSTITPHPSGNTMAHYVLQLGSFFLFPLSLCVFLGLPPGVLCLLKHWRSSFFGRPGLLTIPFCLESPLGTHSIGHLVVSLRALFPALASSFFCYHPGKKCSPQVTFTPIQHEPFPH